MNFFETLESVINGATLTENGGYCYSSTGSDLLDMFASIGGMRGRSDEDIIRLYLAARKENAELADKIVLYARSIRGKGGLGERRIGRLLLKTLACIEPKKVTNNLDLIVENGRFDDLYELEGTPVEPQMWYYMNTTLDKNLRCMYQDKPVYFGGKVDAVH